MASKPVSSKNSIPLCLKAFYPYRFSVLSNMMSEQIAEAYQAFNITIPQWRVLAVLAETPGMTATDIAIQTAMDKAAITRAVQSLIKTQHVQREASQSDGRSSHLQLTKKGWSLYDKVLPEALQYEDEMLSRLSASELSALDKILSKLSHHCSAKGGAYE